jgi:hypothetical protein
VQQVLQRNYLGHATIDNKIRTVNETAFVTSKEKNSLRLLDSLAESARGEMNLTTMSLFCIIAEEVLEQWSTVDQRQ